MARLISLSEFNVHLDSTGTLNPLLYFPDAWIDYRNNRRANFTIESGYPASCAIHQDRFNEGGLESGILRVRIRRWIERSLEGDVILERRNMEYRVRPPATQYDSYPNCENISHGYYIFHFETEAEMMMFRLVFAEFISEISKVHPDKGWMTAENGYKTGADVYG